MSIKIYVEGGGDTDNLKQECRKGFRDFFSKAGLAGKMPSVVACGGRGQAYDRFCTALQDANDDDFIILLVDSEGPVAPGSTAWVHLRNRDNWTKPSGATDESAHLMVQCMESWFMADKSCLSKHFGSGFNENSLPQNPQIEDIPKQDVLDGLASATRPLGTKRSYGKGRDSFKILSRIDPNKVINASPFADQLIYTLLSKAK